MHFQRRCVFCTAGAASSQNVSSPLPKQRVGGTQSAHGQPTKRRSLPERICGSLQSFSVRRPSARSGSVSSSDIDRSRKILGKMNVVPLSGQQPLRQYSWQRALCGAVIKKFRRYSFMIANGNNSAAMTLGSADTRPIRRQCEAFLITCFNDQADEFFVNHPSRRARFFNHGIDRSPSLTIQSKPDGMGLVPQHLAKNLLVSVRHLFIFVSCLLRWAGHRLHVASCSGSTPPVPL